MTRAIKSLLEQSLADWVCELHNDDPEDKYPGEYIKSLKDKRFIVNNHAVNLGGTESFNLAFAGCKEKYASILEDDNWWEPGFLKEMTELMDSKPGVDIAWSNMRIWAEKDENVWMDTGKTVWPMEEDRLFTWPQPQQALGALHSNGAMIFKGFNAPQYVIPDVVKFDGIELVRERSFKHPIYFHAKILANFSVTKITHRTGESWKWTACQVMQLSSMVIASGKNEEEFIRILNQYRHEKSSVVVNFFLANFFYIKDRSLYRVFKLKEWFIYSKWLLKNVMKLAQIRAYFESQSETYDFLLNHTRRRYGERA